MGKNSHVNERGEVYIVGICIDFSKITIVIFGFLYDLYYNVIDALRSEGKIS
jgi:hypothetical protein